MSKKKKLLREVECLKAELHAVRSDYDLAKEKLERAEARLRKAGTEIETVDGPEGRVQVINAEAQAWGTWKYTENEKSLDSCKIHLMHKLITGLMDNNIVQFIVHQPDDTPFSPYNYATVGVKLFVIPWEEMRTGKKIKMIKEPGGPWHE